MRITELVRTYRFLNDPEAPPWTVKFASGFFIALVVAAGFATTWYVMEKEPRANAMESFTSLESDGSRTDYIGYDLDSFTPRLGYDRTLVNKALDTWMRGHPDVTVLDQEPVIHSGFLVGYQVRYAPAT